MAAVFLKDRKDLERCETSKGGIVFGHIGPKASHPAHLTLSDYEDAFLQLCKRNMEELYDPVWGWNDQQKIQQLHRVTHHLKRMPSVSETLSHVDRRIRISLWLLHPSITSTVSDFVK